MREDRFARRYGLLQQGPKIHTKDRARERQFCEAVSWMGHGGARWRFLPAGYGPWNSVYKHFARRGELGIWERPFRAVADELDRQRVLVDATVLRAPARAARAPNQRGIGRPKGAGAPGAVSAPSAAFAWIRSATRASAS